MKCLLLFLNLSVLLSYVAALGIKVQPQTIVGSSTLVLWTRDDTDPASMTFDLRFVQGDADVGLALANLELGEEDDFGTASVTFPAPGQYILKAVTGSPRNTLVGMSKQVAAVGLSTSSAPVTSSTLASGPASATTLAPTATPSSTSVTNTASPPGATTPTSPLTPNPSSPTGSSMPSLPLSRVARHPNLPAIVGGVIGGLLILALLALLFVMLGRRRRAFNRRLTFHKDMMVQPRLMIQPRPDMLSLPSATHASASVASSPTLPHDHDPNNVHNHDRNHLDVEHGLLRTLGSGHIVPSPKGPRPSIKRPKAASASAATPTFLSASAKTKSTAAASTTPTVTVITARAPLEPAPLRTRRQKQLSDRIKMLQGQIEEVQRQQRDSEAYSGMEGGSSEAGDERETKRVLEEMHREMVWLRDHEQSPWAMGLTDVLPPGHARYMTP